MEGRPLGLLRDSRSQQRTAAKPSTDIIELGRRTARGYRNPTNYQLRMLLITGGLDASTHTQLGRTSNVLDVRAPQGDRRPVATSTERPEGYIA